MKRLMISFVAGVLVAGLLAPSFAAEKKAKPGPLTGTWDCMSTGGSQGDMPFTLYLDQQGEIITGSVSSPLGGTDITAGSYKNKTVEIRLETPQGTYLITGKLHKGVLKGEWSHDAGEKGTWEGKKQTATK